MTLEVALGGKSAKAANNLREIKKAVELNPEDLSSAVETFVKLRFARDAIKNGEIDKNAAETFFKNNKEFLDEIPRIRDEMKQAVDANNIFLLRQVRKDNVAHRLNDPKISKAALYIEKGPFKAFQDISELRPKDFKRELASLLKKAGRDDTGDAVEGLQASFFAWLLKKSALQPESISKKAVSILGDPFISGLKLRRMMDTPEIQAMASQILSKEQQRRLALIIRTAERVDQSLRAVGSKEGVIGDVPSKVSSVLARLIGAGQSSRVTAITGSGGIQAAAILSQQAQEVLKSRLIDPATKLLVDAFTSRETRLLEMLLTDIIDEKSLAAVGRQLNAWLAAVLFEQGEKTVPEIADELRGLVIDLEGLINPDGEGRPPINPAIDIGNTLEGVR